MYCRVSHSDDKGLLSRSAPIDVQIMKISPSIFEECSAENQRRKKTSKNSPSLFYAPAAMIRLSLN